MAEQLPWFVIFKPGDENLPGSPWRRSGPSPRGKVSAMPTGLAGWAVLGGFIASIVAVIVVIWAALFAQGVIDAITAAVLTAVFIGGDVTALILIIRATGARWTPELAARLKARGP